MSQTCYLVIIAEHVGGVFGKMRMSMIRQILSFILTRWNRAVDPMWCLVTKDFTFFMKTLRLRQHMTCTCPDGHPGRENLQVTSWFTGDRLTVSCLSGLSRVLTQMRI